MYFKSFIWFFVSSEIIYWWLPCYTLTLNSFHQLQNNGSMHILTVSKTQFILRHFRTIVFPWKCTGFASILPDMMSSQLGDVVVHGSDWLLTQAGLARMTDGLIISHITIWLLFIMVVITPSKYINHGSKLLICLVASLRIHYICKG